MRKRALMASDSRYAPQIEHAFHVTVLVPGSAAAAHVAALPPEPPLRRYVRHLLHADLNKQTVARAVRQLRRLDWTNAEHVALAEWALSAAHLVRWPAVKHLAAVVALLGQHRPHVAVAVGDACLEAVRCGLETAGDPRWAQRRLADTKFAAELFKQRVLDARAVWTLLYQQVTFALDYARPETLPLPEGATRLRCVCTVLTTCGAYLDRRRLDAFLLFAQRFVWLARRHPVFAEEAGGGGGE